MDESVSGLSSLPLAGFRMHGDYGGQDEPRAETVFEQIVKELELAGSVATS